MTRALSRRAVLRGAGGVSMALPFLEAMSGRAHAAAGSAPKRFVAFFTPGGIPVDWWRPTGSGGSSFSLASSVLAPLTPHQQQIIVVEGLELQVAKDGHGAEHTRGMGAFLTGTTMLSGAFETQAKGVGNLAGFASGPSLDQVLGQRLGGASKFKSIQLGLRWPSWIYEDGQETFPDVNPTSILSLEAAGKPVPPATDPQAVFKRLFSDIVTPMDAPLLAAERARDRSILDLVGGEYVRLCKKLGREDCAKLDAHLTKIREIETRLAAPVQQTDGCRAPTMPPAFDYKSNDNMPAASKLMSDLLVTALACNLTPSALLQWGDTSAGFLFSFLGATQDHHTIEHGCFSGQGAQMRKNFGWWAEQFGYLIGEMKKVNEGDRTLLDNSVVYWGSELGDDPAGHKQTNMPIVLAGSAGGYFRTGRWVSYPGVSQTNLLVSLQNAFGIESSTFGDPRYCTGPLPNLT